MHKSTHRHALRLACVALAAVGYALLTACSSADDELTRFIEDTKKQPGGRVEPLPEIKPYETYVYAATDLRSPFSEAYHSIRSNLAFSTNDGAPRVLALTSARPEEGKSTTSLALAQGFARVGGFSAYLQIWRGPDEQCTEAFSHDFVIVNDQNFGLGSSRHRALLLPKKSFALELWR